jgi:hypothetical protein
MFGRGCPLTLTLSPLQGEREFSERDKEMGRTVLPFSQVLEQEVQEWRKFRRGLRKEDQQFLDRLFEEARLHVQAGVYASRPWPFETILISILLEHEKALVELRSKLRSIEKKGVILSDSEESI